MLSTSFKTILWLLVFSCLFTVCSTAQMRPSGSRGGFELTVNQEFDDEGQTLLVISTAIAYRRLVFFRKGSHYDARYRVYMELLDDRNDTVRGDVWEKTVTVQTYEETTASSSVSTTRRSFHIDSGEYMVKVTLEVIDTSLKFRREKAIRIVGRGEGKLELAEPVFTISKVREPDERPPRGEIFLSGCESEDIEGFRMNPGASYAELDAWLRVVFNLVAPPPEVPTDRYGVSIRVKNAQGTVLLYNRKHVQTRASGFLTFCLDINVDDFHMGDYKLSTVVERPGTDERTTAEGRFTVLLNRGIFGQHFQDVIEILSIIADDDELADLREAAPEDRVNAWLRFWKKRDPTPSTTGNEEMDEFLSRINYVLKNFSKLRPGWQTDMGKIYIKYGEPDKIVETDGKVLGSMIQYWIYYSQGLAYIFEDTTGMGDYQLLTTQMI